MKKERYIVEIEMPDGDSASSTWVCDTLQGGADIEDEGRWKVSTSVMQNPCKEDEKIVKALMSMCDEWATRHSYLPKENNDIEKIKSWLKSSKFNVTEEELDEARKDAFNNLIKLNIKP